MRLFLPHPENETVSYTGYRATIRALAEPKGVDTAFLEATRTNNKIFFGHCIHHREAPEALVAGNADAAMLYYHLALRFTRIFPELFALVPLGGTADAPEPAPGNVIAFIHAGLIKDGGRWGRTCLDFLLSRPVAEIYAAHGLDALF